MAAKKKAELVEAKERTTDNILYYTFSFKAVGLPLLRHSCFKCVQGDRNRVSSARARSARGGQRDERAGRVRARGPSERCTSSASTRASFGASPPPHVRAPRLTHLFFSRSYSSSPLSLIQLSCHFLPPWAAPAPLAPLRAHPAVPARRDAVVTRRAPFAAEKRWGKRQDLFNNIMLSFQPKL